MGQPEPHIDLGNGQIIVLGELKADFKQALSLDLMAPDLLPLWTALETFCVAGCCGADAFDFSPQHLSIARRALGADAVNKIQQQLQSLNTLLTQPGPEVVVSHRMNQYLSRSAAQQLLGHIQQNF